MHIQYYLADGQEINYQTAGEWPCMDDINQVALMYAQKRQNVLPHYIFVSVRILQQFLSSSGMYMGGGMLAPGPHIISFMTAAGPLEVKVMPWASDGKLFLIGNMDDFERYDLDKVFEDVVLKDCEREQ